MLIKLCQLMGLHIQLIDKRLNKMKTKANKINYLEEKCQKTLLTEANSYQKGEIFFFPLVLRSSNFIWSQIYLRFLMKYFEIITQTTK